MEEGEQKLNTNITDRFTRSAIFHPVSVSYFFFILSWAYRSGYDLHFHYMGFSIVDQNDRTVPWVPVDPTIILPHHWQKGVIPATFMPKGETLA